MAKPVEIDIKLNGLGAIRSELKALKGELANATDPKDIERLSQAAGKLADQIADANERVKIFAAGSEFEKIGNGIGLVGNQLASLDFEGAAESAKLLTNTIKNLNPAEVANQFKAFASTVGQLGQAFLTMGAQLLLNPIFLLVAVVVAIVAAIILLKDKLYIAQVAFDALAAPIKIAIQLLKDLTDWLGLTSFAEEDAAEKSKQAADKRIKANEAVTNSMDKEYARQIALAKANGKDTTDLQIQQAQSQKKINDDSIKSLKKSYDDSLAYAKTFRKDDRTSARNEAVKAYNEANAAYTAALEKQKDINNQIAVINAEHNTKVAEDQKKANEKSAAEQEKANAKKTKSQKEHDKEIADEKKRQNDLLLELEADLNKDIQGVEAEIEKAKKTIGDVGKSETQIAIDDATLRYDTLIELARVNGLSTVELEKAKQIELDKIKEDANKKSKDHQDELLADLEKMSAADEKDKDDKIKREQQVADAKLRLQNAALDAGVNLIKIGASFAEKNKDIQKGALIAENAIGVAKIIINTMAANALALTNPYTASFVIAANYVTMGISIATAVAATVKGLQALGKGGSPVGGAGGGGGASAPLAPQVNLVGTGNPNANSAVSAQSTQNQNFTIKAVVSETEMTNTQNFIKKVKSSAEI